MRLPSDAPASVYLRTEPTKLPSTFATKSVDPSVARPPTKSSPVTRFVTVVPTTLAMRPAPTPTASLTSTAPGTTSTSNDVANVPDGTTSLAAAVAAVERVVALAIA